MSNFTLVIPTFNRPERLNALLAHLNDSGVDWPIMVLDSGKPYWSTKVVGGLQIAHGQYSEDLHPFAKFSDGVSRVKTEFCALCGDDDVVLPEGVRACVKALEETPTASVCRGGEFAFTPESGNRINPYVRKGISIMDTAPLARLRRYFAHYECCTYGVYRTKGLKAFLAESLACPSLLGRELLSGALAAVAGEMLEVPAFNHGRSTCRQVQRYRHWHPVEWFLTDLEGLAKEYVRFREILVKRLAQPGDNDTCEPELDQIFTQYFWMHRGPLSGLEFHEEVLKEVTEKERAALGRALRHYKL